jgi:hypothetical protein
MSIGHHKNGPRTAAGRISIIHANVTNGAGCFSPVLPGETEADWLAVLNGVRSRIGPVDRLEEEMTYQLALSFWQALRLHKYERAATDRQIGDAAKEESLFGDGDAMTQLLERGVESVRSELDVMEKALGLIGAVALAGDDELLSKEDGLLLLRLAVELVLKGKKVEEAFDGLPPEGEWTWGIVRENLRELAEDAHKDLGAILKSLQARVLEQIANCRKILEDGIRSVHASYVLKDGETERLLLYHSRVQHRISKWLNMLAQSKADRLGLTLVEPVESVNGENGDVALD